MLTNDSVSCAPLSILMCGDMLDRSQDQTPCPPALWPIDPEFIALFEAMTGWTLSFQESASSFHQRRVLLASRSASRVLAHCGNGPNSPWCDQELSFILKAEGSFAISDRSANWPAHRPTAHRGKCERFVELLNRHLKDVANDRSKLGQAKSIFATTKFSSDFIDDNLDMLADTFVPQHAYETEVERDQEFDLRLDAAPSTSVDRQEVRLAHSTETAKRLDVNRHAGCIAAKLLDEPAKANQSLNCGKLETLPHQDEDSWRKTAFSSIFRWRIGGRRGFLERRYVDWIIRDEGHIELLVGQVRSGGSESATRPSCPPNQNVRLDLDGNNLEGPTLDTEDWETKIVLNPATEKFWLTGDNRGRFWIFDQKCSRLAAVPERVCQLKIGQALVVSTASLLQTDRGVISLKQSCQSFYPDRLAKVIQEFIGAAEPVLVLTRIE